MTISSNFALIYLVYLIVAPQWSQILNLLCPSIVLTEIDCVHRNKTSMNMISYNHIVMSFYNNVLFRFVSAQAIDVWGYTR